MRVYIAGPYTKGDQFLNVRKAMRAAATVALEGHDPFVPVLSAFQNLVCPRPYEDWMRIDLAWLEVAQAVVRLPGESHGADAEVARAMDLDIPIYYWPERPSPAPGFDKREIT